jgi:hypothetical protein
MSEVTVRASIITLVEGVTDVGKVYNRQPSITTWDAFLNFFKVRVGKVDYIRGWTVSCEAIAREGLILAGARNSIRQARYTYKIRGYHTVNHANDTENVFLLLALSVMDALDGGIVSGNVYTADLAQLPTYQHRFFGDVLCHYAEITQTVTEQLS